MARARALLLGSDVRLLCLTGAAGSGKSLLAIHLAQSLSAAFPDSVHAVDLTPVRRPSYVLPAIARALGERNGGGRRPLHGLVARLKTKRSLLVLDNFEHVLGAARDVGRLIEACPQLKVIVTSRAPLVLRCEHQQPVAPLAVPDCSEIPEPEALEQYGAVALLTHLATAVRPDFRVTRENAPAVAAICAWLDGLPLAIELVAPRLRVLPPDALYQQLVGGRLESLSGGPHDLPARQRTLRSALDWSYRLLRPAERTLLARLSVFAGGFSLEAVTAVAGHGAPPEHVPAAGAPVQLVDPDVTEGLLALTDKSLLQQAEGPSGMARFAMLGTVREYAREFLDASGETAAIRERHARYYLALAERAAPRLEGPQQSTWLDYLEAEHDNLRAATRWALAHGEGEFALRLTTALIQLWSTRGYYEEGRDWLAVALLVGRDAPAALRARALRGAGRLANRQGDYAAAARHVAADLTLSRQLGDEQAIAHATLNAGIAARLLDDLDQAASLFHESLQRSRGLADLRVVAGATSNLGTVAELHGDRKYARRQYMDALRIIRQLGDIGWEAGMLARIGCVCDDYAGARRLFERSLTLAESVGGPRGVSAVLTRWARAAREAGRFGDAASLYRRQIALARELRHQQNVAGGLEGVAYVAAATGQPERATQLFAAAQALREMTGLALPAQGWNARQQVLELLRVSLGETAFEELWSEGETMRLDQAIEVELAVGTPAQAPDAPQGTLGPPVQDGRLNSPRAGGRRAPLAASDEPADRRAPGHHRAHRREPRPAHPGQTRLPLAAGTCQLAETPVSWPRPGHRCAAAAARRPRRPASFGRDTNSRK